MAAIADDPPSQPRVTIISRRSHSLEDTQNLRIRLHIFKLYLADGWPLGFTSRRILPDELSIPVPLLLTHPPPETYLYYFTSVFSSAKVPVNAWFKIVHAIFARAPAWHSKQYLRVVINIEVPRHREPKFHELRHFKVVGGDEEATTTVDGIDCSICLDGLVNSGGVWAPAAQLTATKHCSHVFHSSCLAEWLRDKDSCPLCRRVIIRYR